MRICAKLSKIEIHPEILEKHNFAIFRGQQGNTQNILPKYSGGHPTESEVVKRYSKNTQKILPEYFKSIFWVFFTSNREPEGGGGRRPPPPLGGGRRPPLYLVWKIFKKYYQNSPGSIFWVFLEVFLTISDSVGCPPEYFWSIFWVFQERPGKIPK